MFDKLLLTDVLCADLIIDYFIVLVTIHLNDLIFKLHDENLFAFLYTMKITPRLNVVLTLLKEGDLRLELGQVSLRSLYRRAVNIIIRHAVLHEHLPFGVLSPVVLFQIIRGQIDSSAFTPLNTLQLAESFLEKLEELPVLIVLHVLLKVMLQVDVFVGRQTRFDEEPFRLLLALARTRVETRVAAVGVGVLGDLKADLSLHAVCELEVLSLLEVDLGHRLLAEPAEVEMPD